jgi:diadenosine tetraphosphatase ApaH/serine/threonine PP2A family protein phosphatase
MRYAIFSDIHANLEALEAVLATIDELAQEEPIDQIWFLGDLVGYGPDPNECIAKLRERTDVIIAGNHDWAAVSKIDLEDFSSAARISAEWTAEQLTEEHRTFLANLPEHIEIGECTLVHGSPYGPLWEYLTSDILAERSFQYFNTRYCFVGHTHVPVIFQQPDTLANTPTLPLASDERSATDLSQSNGIENHMDEDDVETAEMVAVQPPTQTATTASSAMSAYKDPESGNTVTEEEANTLLEDQLQANNDSFIIIEAVSETGAGTTIEEADSVGQGNISTSEVDVKEQLTASPEAATFKKEEDNITPEDTSIEETGATQEIETPRDSDQAHNDNEEQAGVVPSEDIDANTEDQLNSEIEELLSLLGLSQSMIKVTNEMITPPEGDWEAPEGYRAIINPGGVGQPRDGDPRAAFMIYDTERGFEFYRVPYPFEKTQEKIIEAGLPQYLAVRLAYGR